MPVQEVTLVASGARTATGNSGTLDGMDARDIRAQLDVTAVAGTSPTLDVVIQDTLDGTNWNTIMTFAQKTAVSREVVDAVPTSTPSASLQPLFASRWRVVWTLGGSSTAATLATALAGANNDMDFTAAAAGSDGNAITVAYVDPGAASQSLGVVVVGNAITVNLATNGSSVITSTAAQIKTAIDASTPAHALVTLANHAGNDGSGVVTAMAATPLAGGATLSFTFSVVAALRV